ncbi:hypothetical protein M3210_12500 [Oceanobacillus luteolus]|nr:hypothetical protein [Oceanobacillus luteolus]
MIRRLTYLNKKKKKGNSELVKENAVASNKAFTDKARKKAEVDEHTRGGF